MSTKLQIQASALQKHIRTLRNAKNVKFCEKSRVPHRFTANSFFSLPKTVKKMTSDKFFPCSIIPIAYNKYIFASRQSMNKRFGHGC